MSFTGGGNFNIGGGGPGGGRFAQTRGRIQGSMNGVNYPNPFFDVAHTYLPVTVKQLFRFCRYYFLTNPLINATACKLSEYPITDIIIDHENTEVKNRWTEYFHDHLQYRPFQVECGLDHFVYGNCFTSLSFPFYKFLTCTKCKFTERADKIRNHWTFTNFDFRLNCPRCGEIAEAVAYDHYIKNASGIRMVRWNPEDLEVDYDQLSGKHTYFYSIPGPLKNDVIIGKKNVVETTPQIFIQALRQRKGVVFSKDNLFHLKRPTLAGQDRGWGIPLLLPVLKDVFLMQMMRKAQECVAPSTLLETPSGLIAASHICEGDLVKTHLGRYSPVTAKQIRPVIVERGDFAVELAITGMRQLPSTFSNNHPMWVLRRNNENRRSDSKEMRRSSYVLRNPSLYAFDWVDAGEVTVGDYIGYPTARERETCVVDAAKYTSMVATSDFVYSGVSVQTASAFEALEHGEHVAHDNPGRVAKRHVRATSTPKRLSRQLELDEDLAYIAGWYTGDGSIGARRVDFSMGPDDDGVELQQAIERVFGGTFASYPCKNSRGWMLCAFDTIFSDFIGGWIAGHAKEKKIPVEIMTAPDAVVLAFLRGYLEADGWQRSDDEKISVCCANQFLTYQLWTLALSLGCISTLSERLSYDSIITKLDGSVQLIEGGKPTFYWTLSNRSARRLNQLMLGKEAESVTSGKSGFFVHGYFAARVQSTSTVECREVISFEVAEDHTFCTPGMATHNSVILEHIVPLRCIFPQAATGSSDPFSTVNLVDWRDQVANEIARWRWDNNYVPIMALPIGQQTIGGDGKALLLFNELQAISDTVIMGMGVPTEFLRGGLSFSGTQVSMRMLENAFLSYIGRHRIMAKWVMKMVANFTGWPEAHIRFKPFKMADDLQRKAYLFQLNQAGKVSDTTLLADADLNQEEENKIIVAESVNRIEATRKQQLAMAQIQGEAQVIMQKLQAKAQQTLMQAQQSPMAPGEPGAAPGAPALGASAPEGAAPTDFGNVAQSPLTAGSQQGQGQMGVDLTRLAQSYAAQIGTLPGPQQAQAIQALAAQSPELAQLVKQFMSYAQPGQEDAGVQPTGVDQRALPGKMPPRRQTAVV